MGATFAFSRAAHGLKKKRHGTQCIHGTPQLGLWHRFAITLKRIQCHDLRRIIGVVQDHAAVLASRIPLALVLDGLDAILLEMALRRALDIHPQKNTEKPTRMQRRAYAVSQIGQIIIGRGIDHMDSVIVDTVDSRCLSHAHSLGAC